MTTAEKCEEIVKSIVKRCDDDSKAALDAMYESPDDAAIEANADPTAPRVMFGSDYFGKFALTVYVNGTHTHCAGDTFERLVDRLYRTLVTNNPPMSYAIPADQVSLATDDKSSKP